MDKEKLKESLTRTIKETEERIKDMSVCLNILKLKLEDLKK
jgi:hypothetical protein